MAAIRNDDNLLRSSFQSLSEVLFPEIEEKRQDFRKTAAEQMKFWKDRVIEISGSVERKTMLARTRKVADVEPELVQLMRESYARQIHRRRK